MLRDIVFALTLVLFVVMLAYATANGGMGPLPPSEPRPLAIKFLNLTYNPFNKNMSAMAPEAVTAILWDYRGLDTIFETVVFYGAIVATLTVYRATAKEMELTAPRGLSLVVKRVTAVVSVMIVVVAAATALHGHLTPGGGFQAGSIAAVAPLTILVVFSKRFLIDRGVNYARLLIVRNIGLIGLGITAIALLILSYITLKPAFILQNQAKSLSPLSFPTWFLDVPSGGSLWFFNLFEMIAVAAGFTLIFIVLASSETLARKEIEGEEHGF